MKKQLSDELLEKLSQKDVPILLLSLIIAILTWALSASLFWHLVYKKSPLKIIGYDKPVEIIIGLSILLCLMKKNKILIPVIAKNPRSITILITTNWIAGFIAIMLTGSLMMHFFLMEGPLINIINEAVYLFFLITYILIINQIVIPAIKNRLEQKRI
jgi:hypothetical protein